MAEKDSKHQADAMIFIRQALPRRRTVKLDVFFIVMDLLTLLAYPILFVHGKLRQSSRSKENCRLPNLLITGSVAVSG